MEFYKKPEPSTKLLQKTWTQPETVFETFLQVAVS